MFFVAQHVGRDQHGKNQLVVLEDTATNVDVRVQRNVVDDGLDARWYIIALLALVHPHLEEIAEIFERPLVHWVDVSHVGDDEI